MKRYMIPLILTLCLCLLAGCDLEGVLSGIRGPAAGEAQTDAAFTPDPEDPLAPENAPDREAANGDAVTGEGVGPEEEASGAPEPLPDFTHLTVDECIEDLWPGEQVLPRIALVCPGAEEINAAIDSGFSDIAEDPIWNLRYEAAKGFGGRVLSVVMIQGGDNDWTGYTPYNLDLLTGQALSGPELLALVGQDEAELKNLESALLGEEFTHQFGDGQGVADQTFFQSQYERTTSLDNTQVDRLWFSADGTLLFTGRIYGMAGAEYYEYPISTGLVF